MASGLSSQSESYLNQIVASGLFPSKEAALEAAVAALREKNDEIPFVPEAHMALVEEALASSAAGHSRPMTEEDWDRLRERAYKAAANSRGDSTCQ